ncbi:DUF3971 domain-containing protein [Ascidiaceihabitans sp.]|uniref:YhdP family protein n=1 Tax=Ascidiaceihabitans sp. TaxID=1872644 RepID=UPI003298AFFA
MSTKTDTPVAPQKAAPKRRLRRFGAWIFSVLFVLSLAAFVGIVAMTGRTVTVPDWLHDRIEERASTAFPGGSVVFGEAQFVVNNGWRPRVRVEDLQVKNNQGIQIVAFSQAEASLAMRPLLRGEIIPKSINLTGVFATLLRDADGSVSLRGGDGLAQAPAQTAATLPELIEGLDRVLQLPGLSALVNAELQALTLRYEDVRIGEVWVVDGGRVRLLRDGSDLTLAADLALLSGGAGVATLSANYASKIGETKAEFGVNVSDVQADDIATQSPALAWLEVLRAPISGALRSGVNTSGGLAPLSATLQIGAGVLQPTEETKPIPFDSARSYFTYDPSQQVIDFAELSVKSKWVSGRMEGQAFLGGMEAGALEDLIGQFRFSDLQFNPADLYDQAIAFDAADMDFRLTLNPFKVSLGQMQVRDADQSLILKGDLAAEAKGWRYGVDARMDAIALDRLLALWPERLVPPTRNWIAQNIIKGNLRALDASLRGAPNQAPDVYASFDFSDATVRYTKTLPPVEGAQGQASFLDNRFVAAVEVGHVVAPQGGRINVAGSAFIIPDVTIKGGPPSVARLRTSGTITSALAMLNAPPLNVMTKAGFAETLADGQAELEGTMSIPLKTGLTTQEIGYDVVGVLRGVKTDQLVPGKTMAADTLQVVASSSGVEISGQGRLGAVPFDAIWAQPLGAEAASGSTVRGTVELSERTIDEFNIGLPAGTVSGRGIGEIALDLVPDTAPSLRLTSNLRGLKMGFAPLGWSKPAQTAGKMDIVATLGDQVRVNKLAIDAPGLSAAGNVTLTNGGLDRASFSRVRAGTWLDAPITLVGQGGNAPPRIEARGGTLDLRTADFSGSGAGAGGRSGPMTVSFDRLQITDSIALTDMRGSFKTQGGLDGKFSGRVNGGATVTGRILPQNGRSAVRITGIDAGAVFASAGLLKQARGGDLSLTLLPVGRDGAFDGKLTVTSTRIKDAPAIAALLNALSIVGLLEQMGGSGIHFQEIEADFRLTPSTMTLTQASAVGPSMGISMDGVYAVDSGRLDMRGVVSPIYLVNGIGSLFTRKGEGLIGFNYNLSGQAKNPRVQVNPLSALTPGMFRNIFRAPPPKVPELEGGGAPTPKALLPDGGAVKEKPKRQPNLVEDR